MSRHLRRIERMDSVRSKRPQWISVWGLTSDMLTPGMRGRMKSRHGTYEFTVGKPEPLEALNCFRIPDEPATITNLDADHAVANEREAIAQMVSRCAEVVRDNPLEFRFGGRAEADRLWSLAQQIRNGDHHANTPPSAQEQG